MEDGWKGNSELILDGVQLSPGTGTGSGTGFCGWKVGFSRGSGKEVSLRLSLGVWGSLLKEIHEER